MCANYVLEASLQVLSKFRAATRTRNVAYTRPMIRLVDLFIFLGAFLPSAYTCSLVAIKPEFPNISDAFQRCFTACLEKKKERKERKAKIRLLRQVRTYYALDQGLRAPVELIWGEL